MFWKRTLPVIIALISGLLGLAFYYIPHPVGEAGLENANIWLRIVAAFAMFIGVASLFSSHWTKIKRKTPGWGYSLVVFFGFFSMFVFSVYNEGNGLLAPRVDHGSVDWIYENIVVPAMATMFALLAFFVASAAFRTFRAKSTEAAILLIAAVIVMFGQIPLSSMVSEAIPALSAWLLDVPNLAVKRALYIGMCLGTVAVSIRIIFGIERSYLGGD